MQALLARLRTLHPISIFAIVFAIALIVRLIVFYQVSRDPAVDQLSGDGRAYVQWADTISKEGWIGHEVFYQTPLYPHLLAVLRGGMGMDFTTIRIVQAIVGSAGCGLLALGTRRLMGSPTSGLIAGLLLTLYPAAISFDLQIDKPVLDAPLMAGIIWCVGELIHRPKPKWWLACGALCGLAALTRENALIFLPVLVALALFPSPGTPAFGSEAQARRGEGEGGGLWFPRIKAVTLLLAGAICVLLPVIVRNTLISGEFHLITSQFGPNFYIGNSANADGIYRPLRPGRADAQFERIDATELAEQGAGHPLAPAEVSHYWSHKAFQEITEEPGRWMKLMGSKLLMAFANTELADSDVHDRFIVWSSLLNALDSIWGFGVLFALACAGVVMLWDQRRTLWPIAAMAVVYAISLAMFFIFARYRMMLVTLLVPLAAAALTQLAERIRQPSALLAAALAAALAIGIIWLGDRSIPPRIKGTNDYNRAITAASRGQIDRAIQLYQRAITANPQLSAAYQNLGLLLVDRGDVERATQRLTEAVRLEPGDAVARVNLGMTLARRGSLSSAIEQFETAMRIDPASTAAQWNLAMALHASGREGEAHDILGKIASSTSSDPFARRAAEFLKIESTQPSSQPSSRK